MTLWAVRKTSQQFWKNGWYFKKKALGKFWGSWNLRHPTPKGKQTFKSHIGWTFDEHPIGKKKKTKKDTIKFSNSMFTFHLPLFFPPKKIQNETHLSWGSSLRLFFWVAYPKKAKNWEAKPQASPQSWGLGGVIRWNFDARGPWFPIFTSHQWCTTRAGTCISANFCGRNSAGWQLRVLGATFELLIRWRRYF